MIIDREMGFIATIIGAAIIAACILLTGKEPAGEKRGPRWRRLIAAGTVLLASLGIVEYVDRSTDQPAGQPTAGVTETNWRTEHAAQKLAIGAALRAKLEILRTWLGQETFDSAAAAPAIDAVETDMKARLAAVPAEAKTGEGKPAGPEHERTAVINRQDALARTVSLRSILDQDNELERRAEWRRFLAVRLTARALDAGFFGTYPFTVEQKKQLLADLEAGQNSLAGLRDDGLLTAVETEYLVAEATELGMGVSSYRPVEMLGATCYTGFMWAWDEFFPGYMPLYGKWAAMSDDWKTLEQRLVMLKQLSAERSLHPDAVREVLVDIRYKAAFLEEVLANVSEEHRAQAGAALERIDNLRAAIEAKMAAAN